MNNIYLHLQRILQKIGLDEKESLMLVKCYLYPGLTPGQLGKQCGFKRMMSYRTLESLIAKNFVELVEKKQSRTVHPVALSQLAARVDRKCADLKRFAGELVDINKLLRYPNVKNNELAINTYYGDEAREMFYDLHYFNWDCVWGCGNFDIYMETMGWDFERVWIDKRVRKGRQAKAFHCGQGSFTREILKLDGNDLRNSKSINNLRIDKWLTLLPEIDTSIIFKVNPDDQSDWSLSKIESKEVSDSYTTFFSSFS